MSEILRLSGVSQSYGHDATLVHAVKDVSLAISSGELVAIMGPSGSGKTTLLGIAGGMERPVSGEVFIEGTPLSTLDSSGLAVLRRRSIGYIFQRYNLIPLLTVRENVALALELDHWPRERVTQATHDALAAVSMLESADLYPENLSGGEQQRAAIARAVAGHPRLILADEPTGALDSVTGESVVKILRERVDAGAAGIVVTHNARLAAWADRVYTLDDGVLHEAGEPRS